MSARPQQRVQAAGRRRRHASDHAQRPPGSPTACVSFGTSSTSCGLTSARGRAAGVRVALDPPTRDSTGPHASQTPAARQRVPAERPLKRSRRSWVLAAPHRRQNEPGRLAPTAQRMLSWTRSGSGSQWPSSWPLKRAASRGSSHYPTTRCIRGLLVALIWNSGGFRPCLPLRTTDRRSSPSPRRSHFRPSRSSRRPGRG